MIEKTLTALLSESVSTGQEIPGCINDTFICGSSIYFICPISLYNTLTNQSITSTNIGQFLFQYKIFNNLTDYQNNTNIINTNTQQLSSSNIVNNYLVIKLNELDTIFTNDFLYDIAITDELLKLLKSFKISFNITNSQFVSEKDIVQDINFILDTTHSGPFDIDYSEIQFLDAEDFSDSERINFSQICSPTLGEEKVRAFYPKNLSQCPLVVMQHGNGQSTESYDFYLSKLASYGYFCISMYNDTTSYPLLPLANILILNHIKNNKDKIKNGIFNKINFNKINFIGHSRGGAATIISALYLKNKNSINSKITSVNLNYSDIKTICSIADVFVDNITSDFLLVSGTLNVSFEDLQENQSFFLDPKIDKPLLCLLPGEDTDANQMFSILPSFLGFSYDIKRNVEQIKIITSPYGSHNVVSEFYYGQPTETLISVVPIIYNRNDSKIVYNTFNPLQNSYCSELIYFFSSENFSNDKIKKLNYCSDNLKNKKLILEESKKNQIDIIEYTKYSDIKYLIDSFRGLTLSLAGITGATFNCSGATYDYCLDSSIYLANANMGNTLSSLYKELKCYPLIIENVNSPAGLARTEYNLSDNDNFNGIFHLNYRGLYFPVTSNSNIGYTFSNSLNLDENDYFALKACLKYFYPVTVGNTFDANFKIKLKDVNNNYSELSSSIFGSGFKKPYNQTTTDFINAKLKVPTIANTVYFRAGDFYLNNNLLGITHINEITISFGPDYGSTFAHLALDEFVVIKEL